MTGYFVMDGKISEVKGEQKALDYARAEGGTVYWDRAMAENTLAYGDDVTARQVEARAMLADAGMTAQEINLWHFGTPGVPNAQLGRAMDKLNEHKTPPWLAGS